MDKNNIQEKITLIPLLGGGGGDPSAAPPLYDTLVLRYIKDWV